MIGGEDGGRGNFGAAGIEWRGRGVFQPQLQRLCIGVTGDFGDQSKGKIDAGGNAAAGKDVAIAHDTGGIGDGAEFGQQVTPLPMARGALAAQQSGGAKDERASADRGDIARAERQAADMRQIFGVERRFGGGEAAGYTQDIAAFDGGQRGGAAEHHAAFGLDFTALRRGNDGHGPGKAGKKLEWPGKIELRQLRIQRKNDGERRGSSSHGGPFG